MSNKRAYYVKEDTTITIKAGESALVLNSDGTEITAIMSDADADGVCNSGSTAICAMACMVEDEEAINACIEAYIGD